MKEIRVAELRELDEGLSTPDLWKVGVFALIFRNGGGEDQILMVREEEEWSLPGGGVEVKDLEEAAKTGSDPLEEGIRRELSEEIGVEAVVIETSMAIPEMSHSRMDLALGLLVKIKGDPRPCGEIVEARWVRFSELQSPHLKVVGPRIRQMAIRGFCAHRNYGFHE
jgi:ADP-ribose pyrophosphatase YjhB (NUDIX family)